MFSEKYRNLDILSVQTCLFWQDIQYATEEKKKERKEESINPLSVCMSRALYYNDQILSLTTKVTAYFGCQSMTGFYHSGQQL